MIRALITGTLYGEPAAGLSIVVDELASLKPRPKPKPAPVAVADFDDYADWNS